MRTAKAPQANGIGFLLRAAVSRYNAVFLEQVKVCRDHQLTPNQYAVLAAVAAHPHSVAQADLVKQTGIDRSTLSDTVSRMIKADLLQAEEDTDDRRRQNLRLTNFGSLVHRESRENVRRAELAFLREIAAVDRQRLQAALTKLAEAA